MSDSSEESADLPMGALGELTLRIPGEHFFCETISLSPKVKEEELYEIAERVLGEKGFSPYPVDQLAWGFHACLEVKKMMIFACPSYKLRQLGWQNLEIFRRVFPSFVSLLGKKFEDSTVAFLIHEDTLTAASFAAGSTVPDCLFSLPIEMEDEDSIDRARGKLLSLMDLERYEVSPDILVTGEVSRMKDGFFHFEHQWLEGMDPTLELEQETTISAASLWDVDLRPPPYKFYERKRRRQARMRWKGVLGWTLSMAALVILFLGVKIAEVKLDDKKTIAQRMAAEVPLVIESQKLLEKLKQNKLGGIDPFGALGRVAVHRGGSGDQPALWFTKAHFDSRNEITLEGSAKTVEAVNNFVEKLKLNEVAKVVKDGKKSAGGNTTFDLEMELIEIQVKPKVEQAELETIEVESEPG